MISYYYFVIFFYIIFSSHSRLFVEWWRQRWSWYEHRTSLAEGIYRQRGGCIHSRWRHPNKSSGSRTKLCEYYILYIFFSSKILQVGRRCRRRTEWRAQFLLLLFVCCRKRFHQTNAETWYGALLGYEQKRNSNVWNSIKQQRMRERVAGWYFISCSAKQMHVYVDIVAVCGDAMKLVG